jgi:hypothetical protein
MLSQGLMVRFAIRTYYLMGREPSDTGVLVMSLIPTAIYFVLLLVVFFVGVFVLFPPEM